MAYKFAFHTYQIKVIGHPLPHIVGKKSKIFKKILQDVFTLIGRDPPTISGFLLAKFTRKSIIDALDMLINTLTTQFCKYATFVRWKEIMEVFKYINYLQYASLRESVKSLFLETILLKKSDY